MKKNHYGFNLLELLIALSIISILVVIMLPSFSKFYQKSQANALSSQLLRAIQLSRSVAVTQQAKTIMCGSLDQKTCSSDWRKGYIILNENGVVFKFQGIVKNSVLHWRAFPFYLKALEFLSSGLPNFQNGTFWYCMSGSKNPFWAIMLSQSGRARLVRPSESGVIEDEKHQLLAC